MTFVPLTATMRTWVPAVMAVPSWDVAPQTSPWAVTRPRRSVSSGSIGDGDDARQADQPVGADAGLEFVVAGEDPGVPVQQDPQQGATAGEDEPLDLDRNVVETEERREERGDGERQQHERTCEHRELDQREEHCDAEPYPWPEVQVDPEIQHRINLPHLRLWCSSGDPFHRNATQTRCA